MVFGGRIDELESDVDWVAHDREGADEITGGGGREGRGWGLLFYRRREKFKRGTRNENRLKLETHMRAFPFATEGGNDGLGVSNYRWYPRLRGIAAAGPGRNGSHQALAIIHPMRERNNLTEIPTHLCTHGTGGQCGTGPPFTKILTGLLRCHRRRPDRPCGDGRVES